MVFYVHKIRVLQTGFAYSNFDNFAAVFPVSWYPALLQKTMQTCQRVQGGGRMNVSSSPRATKILFSKDFNISMSTLFFFGWMI